MDSEETSKITHSFSNKEFSLKDAPLMINLLPLKINEEEKVNLLTEKNNKLKSNKSSHIQTGLTTNNKLKVRVKTQNKSIDVLMKKAYELRKSNDNFNYILKARLILHRLKGKEN
jgi:hypothetical protein